MTNDQLPLTGIRVADFTWFGAGPIYTQILANHGAQVIRVESQTHIDGLRLAHPMPEGKFTYNVSGYYNNFNASKLSFSPEHEAPQGPRCGPAPHRPQRHRGRELHRRHPGEDGASPTRRCWPSSRTSSSCASRCRAPVAPTATSAASASSSRPLAGVSHLSGFPHREPVGLGTNYTDYVINPGHAAIATLAALHYRNRTGKGQLIEVAQVESSICAVSTAILDYTANGRVDTRQGNRLGHAAPHGAYRCAGDDRWCTIAVFTDDEWRALCRAMGDPEWAREERFATLQGRKENEDELDLLIEGWTAERSAEEVMETLQAAGVPAGVVQSARDVLENDPHLKARGYYVYQDHPEAGRTAYDGPGFRLSKTPGRLLSPAPMLGEHTALVCTDVLGMDDEEMAQLVMESVLF